MRIERDAEVDAAYIYVVDTIKDGEAVTQVRAEMPPGSGADINLDLDSRGFLLGIEILGASRVLRPHPG